jgi:hypothetical protein
VSRKPTIYYHFTANKLRDGSPIPPIGEWLTCKGELFFCNNGLHASEHPFDALNIRPGPYLHRVELGGHIVTGDDKLCARKRKIIATIDATKVLRSFARNAKPSL